MTADVKTPLEQVNAALAQLKEMRHCSRTYVEQLTAQWLLFDGPLKKLKQAGKFEELMTRQAEFHEVLAGRGPMNAVRVQNRRDAHERGAWVREAAAAYATKKAAQAARAADSARSSEKAA